MLEIGKSKVHDVHIGFSPTIILTPFNLRKVVEKYCQHSNKRGDASTGLACETGNVTPARAAGDVSYIYYHECETSGLVSYHTILLSYYQVLGVS